MDHYFFHLQAADLWPDDEGTELEDIEAAKRHAVQYMVEHLYHHPNRFWEAETFEVRVADKSGLTLLVISLVATLSPPIPRGAAAAR